MQEINADAEAGGLKPNRPDVRDDLSFCRQISSTEEQTSNHREVGNNSNDGAEGIVRAAARTVRNLRAVLICLILAATAACAVLIYKLSSKNEADAFEYSFDEVATKLTQSFTSVIFENLNYANILSVALSSRLFVDSDYTPSFANVSIYEFDTLTWAVRNRGLVTSMIWSPLLYSRAEKNSWESYAKMKLLNISTASAGSTAQYPPCYMCGEGYSIVNGEAQVTFSGIGTFACAEIEEGALAGYINAQECSFYAATWQRVCGCQKSVATNQNATNSISANVVDGIFVLDNGVAVPDRGRPPYSPVWQISPSVNTENVVMFNQMSESWRRAGLNNMIETQASVFSKTFDPKQEAIYKLGSIPTFGQVASMFYPVFESANSEKIVGSFAFDFPWELLFTATLPPQADGTVIVLENTMAQSFTYRVDGGAVIFQGQGDLHDQNFDSMKVESTYDDFNQTLQQGFLRQRSNKGSFETTACLYRIRVYPSGDFRSKHVTNKPVIYTAIVVVAFVLTSLVFYAYDLIVRRIQYKVLNSAKRSEEIVSSLFPDLVRDRLFRNRTNSETLTAPRFSFWTERNGVNLDNPLVNHKARLKTYLSHPPSLDACNESEPIADLYPNTTVLFADIAGFTAWSSEREPPLVFKLLESLYSEFDEVARELGVFKVETIGDCYVAVTGLPEKTKFHAVVMVEFAFRCLVRMRDLLSKLELVLGPGTADLSVRIGLNSGPVTAGVLRGDRARFQLFGDTINVASRMESTGTPSMVHISKETADLLIEAGYDHWVTERQEPVSVKGKGLLQTFWASPSLPAKLEVPNERSITGASDSCLSSTTRSDGLDVSDPGAWGATSLVNALAIKPSASSVRNRLVEWNADLLQGLLQKIVVKRNANAKSRAPFITRLESATASCNVQFLREITEVIEVAGFDERTLGSSNSIDLGTSVRSQLRTYVAHIASLYRDNAFHNFEHACHVAMSASKLLKRIIAPDDVDCSAESSNSNSKTKIKVSKEIHMTTFGISSDPLMQFAVVFSALIHDVDHTGLTNKQLVMEEDPLAIKYDGKCVAEQRSIQVAWDALMEDRFVDLRRCIYQTEEEKQRFRQLLVNAVIATDIADKELSAWRKSRWDKVFHQSGAKDDETMSDRKATIVFEYIIQASDVAHTMQHWHVYQKWNKRLFDERYAAYLAGRDSEDPSIGWHKGEIWFFDNYIIPLAKKLEECNVFGVSCDEYLTYALQNRNEWEMKGEHIVAGMVSSKTNCMNIV